MGDSKYLYSGDRSLVIPDEVLNKGFTPKGIDGDLVDIFEYSNRY